MEGMNKVGGYISAEQLEDPSFQEVYLEVHKGLNYLDEDAKRIEQSLDENDDFSLNDNAQVFLRDFCTMMTLIDRNVFHPADFEKMFRVEGFRAQFVRSIENLKKFKIIDIVENLSDKKEEGYDPSYDRELVKMAKDYLLQAEIYLSQFK